MHNHYLCTLFWSNGRIIIQKWLGPNKVNANQNKNDYGWKLWLRDGAPPWISPQQIRPLKKLTKSDTPINCPINSPWIAPLPRRYALQKSLWNQIGSGRYHRSSRYIPGKAPELKQIRYILQTSSYQRCHSNKSKKNVILLEGKIARDKVPIQNKGLL